jgi:hypothetical protein
MAKQLELNYTFKVGDRVITPTGRIGTVLKAELNLPFHTLVEFDEIKPRTKKQILISSIRYLIFTDILKPKS